MSGILGFFHFFKCRHKCTVEVRWLSKSHNHWSQSSSLIFKQKVPSFEVRVFILLQYISFSTEKQSRRCNIVWKNRVQGSLVKDAPSLTVICRAFVSWVHMSVFQSSNDKYRLCPLARFFNLFYMYFNRILPVFGWTNILTLFTCIFIIIATFQNNDNDWEYSPGKTQKYCMLIDMPSSLKHIQYSHVM